MGRDFVGGERLRRLDDLASRSAKLIEREIEADERGALQARLGDRLAERAARDALGANGEASAGERKFLVVNVEPEGDAFAALVVQRQEALAAEIERQARLLERPFAGRRRLAAKLTTPSTLGQGAPSAIGAPLQRQPSISRALAHPPEGEFALARFQAIEALIESQRHGDVLPA